MARKMKRANGLLGYRDGDVYMVQARAVAQAATKKRMLELVQKIDSTVKMGYLNDYWLFDAWGNEAERLIGDTEEEGVWIAFGTNRNGYNATGYKKVA